MHVKAYGGEAGRARTTDSLDRSTIDVSSDQGAKYLSLKRDSEYELKTLEDILHEKNRQDSFTTKVKTVYEVCKENFTGP